ncbi:MAG: HGxxPAAW family protein [Nocardioides sp.]|jgi:hydrogenase/urease accessory protein HupE
MSHHGNTPAAWTGVTIAMLGFVIGGIALMLTPINLPIFWVGVVLGVIALPVFMVMNKMGYGD